ncbi:MAG: ABC-F family ATP-binding cassette domain-containing protein [Bacteroidota bacterium]
MIYLQHLDLAFGGQPIFTGLTWTIRPGERVGLIGPNGAGKSTLLRVIAGEQAIDGGQVGFDGGATVGYLRQDVQEMDLDRSVLEEAMTAFQHVLDLEADERDLAAQMTQALAEGMAADAPEYTRLVERHARVHAELAAAEHHLIKPKTEAILAGLGFSEDEMLRPLHTFSGGWRMRVALAQLLLQQPSALLLDEPTNHLDIESIGWLEEYLRSYPGAVVVVSHDRYFLDRMVTQIAELRDSRIDEYAGTYSYYMEEREERIALQAAAYENQQRMIAETERFIERFRYKATKAKQVQSRVKMLDKLERIPPPPSDDAAIRFRFPEPAPSGRAVLELSPFSKAYPTHEGTANVVFEDAGPLRIERGQKLALIGKNGAGKSTLARILIDTEDFDGNRDEGYRVTTGYFAQHQADDLDPSQNILEALREKARGHSDTELRALAGAFLFHGDDVFKPVAVLSGGERSRVALARTLLSPVNFLVLDEPTNHLDIASKKVLAEALRQYGGTFVLISHDRAFLDEVVNAVWYVEHGDVRTYEGTYTEVQWQRTHGTAAHVRQANGSAKKTGTNTSAMSSNGRATSQPKPASASSSGSSGGKKSKEEKRREAELRNQLYRALQKGETLDAATLPKELLRPALERVENTIAKKEEEKDTLEVKMADPDLYNRPDEFSATMDAFAEAEQELKRLYAQWESLAARAEEVGA